MSSRNDPDSQRSLPAGDPDAIAEGGRHFAAGRYAESLAIVDAALARTPAVPELLFARGSALFGWGRHHEALASFRRAADAGLVHFDLDMQLGWCCVHVQKLDEAEVHFRKAVATEPESDSAYVALANVLEMRGMLAAQAGEFARGLSRWPDNYDAVILHAACKLYRNERDAGVATFRQAIANDPARSRAWSNLGVTLDWATQLPEALAALQRAVEIDSEDARPGDGFLNLATLLRERGRRAEALHLLERNLLRNPDPKGHWLYSVMLLETGHLEEGWEQHEFRWLKEPLLSRRWSMRCPIWQGQDVCGKTVLLHAEQGFGDAIQFIRYARRLKDLGARVVFDTFKGFDEISRDFDSVDEVLVDGAVPPHFDYRIPLLSLPRVFGTDLASIPATVPYVKVRPAYLDTWTQRIPAAGEFKVGLVWAGNPKHQRDRQRSIPLSTLAPLFGVEGVRFHSLQKSPTAAAEIAASGFDLVDLGPDLNDFCDTVAAISRLDLVISVDTSVAHLAGALAKPVWLMLPTPPDWRWLLEGSDTAWYPTMRLFRQREANRWESVAEEVGQALGRRVGVAGAEAAGSASTAPAAFARIPGERPGEHGAASEPLAHEGSPRLCRVTEARYGIVQYVPGAGDAADGLHHYGEHRHAELALMGRFIRPGGWVLQVGAGIGVDSLFLSQAVGDAGHLLAYEPDRLRHQLAYQNLAANRVRNVTLLRRYLGRGPERDPAADRPGVAAASHTDWIDGLRLERLDWLRINAGRSAPGVLAGAADSLWRLRPWAFVCVDSEAESGAVAAAMRDHGYQSWRFDVPLFNPDNYNRRSDDIFSGRRTQGVLCIPEEIEMDIDLDGCTAIASATG